MKDKKIDQEMSRAEERRRMNSKFRQVTVKSGKNSP